jgi:RimJ/RimL family protein N-acetyltransferase
MILRLARVDDARLIWMWRNDSVTQAMFRTSDEVSWEEHRDWYGRSLANAGRWMLVGEDAGHPLGILRLDRKGRGSAEVNINVSPDNRGRGVGRDILALGVDYAAGRLGLVRLEANIKPENAASVALFKRAGFMHAGSENGLEKYVLSLPLHRSNNREL